MKIFKNLSFWAGLLVLVYASIFFVESLSMKYYSSVGPGPGFFPRWLNGILVILAVCFLVNTIKKDAVNIFEVLPKGKQALKVVRYPAAILIFIILTPYAGFIITCTFVMTMLLISEMKFFWNLGISIATSLVLFIVFKHLLGVPLPVNVFGW